MSEGLIPVPVYVSPELPIRLALGKLGYSGSYFQTLKDDMVEWIIECQDKISRKHTFVPYESEEEVKDNKIRHCFKMIECVGDGCQPFTYQASGSCAGICTDKCKTICCGNPQSFTIDECYINFSPALPDGAKVKTKGYARKLDANGVPLIHELCVPSTTQYVMWMLCFREKDNRAGACEARYYNLVRQDRANLRAWINANLVVYGIAWSGKGGHVN